MEGTPCTKCNHPDKKATVRCLDCKEFFCDSCHTLHDSWTSLKGHKLLVIRDLCPEWKQTGQIKTDPYLFNPSAIAVHSEGNIVVTNGGRKLAAIFNKHENMTYCLGLGLSPVYSETDIFESSLIDVAITPDKRYVFPDRKNILFYNSKGKRLESSRETRTMASDPKSLAVDTKGVIIVGSKKLKTTSRSAARSAPFDDRRENRLFLFHSDGRAKSDIPAPAEPRSLTAKVDEEIVISFWNNTLQVTNYTGRNYRVIQPPLGVTNWIPGPVCCTKQGEIYVINYGDTFAVYKYLIDGDLYLGCPIKGLHNPTGIAISDDGQKIYITEGYQNVVKIFQNQ